MPCQRCQGWGGSLGIRLDEVSKGNERTRDIRTLKRRGWLWTEVLKKT